MYSLYLHSAAATAITVHTLAVSPGRSDRMPCVIYIINTMGLCDQKEKSIFFHLCFLLLLLIFYHFHPRVWQSRTHLTVTPEHTSALPKLTDSSWQQIRKQISFIPVILSSMHSVACLQHFANVIEKKLTMMKACRVFILLVRGGNVVFRCTSTVFKQCSQGPLELNKVVLRWSLDFLSICQRK